MVVAKPARPARAYVRSKETNAMSTDILTRGREINEKYLPLMSYSYGWARWPKVGVD